MKQLLAISLSLLEIFTQRTVQIIPVPAARQLTNRAARLHRPAGGLGAETAVEPDPISRCVRTL